MCCCCCGIKEAKRSIPHYHEKVENLCAADVIYYERIDLQNYLHDSMDLYAIRQLMMKSRHQILMPMLILHLTKTKTMSTGAYKSSFVRTLHERTDAPVFTVEDAVAQIKNVENEPRSKIEKSMDEFYYKNLPASIMGEDANEALELDEANIKMLKQQDRIKASKVKTANYLHGEVVNPQRPSIARAKIIPEDESGRPRKKKGKSDLTLAMHDSKEVVERLEKKMKVAAEVEEKRRSTMIDRKGTGSFGSKSPKRMTMLSSDLTDGMGRRLSGGIMNMMGGSPSNKKSGFQGSQSPSRFKKNEEWDDENEEM